jgi:hypothetical protein
MDNGMDIKAIIREALEQFVSVDRSELAEERKRREQLESRMNALVEENNRSRARAEEVERASTIRTELQRLGVAKLDLAFRAVKDDISRAEDGRLIARTDMGDVGLKEFLTHFVNENPELLPARMSGGSGASVYGKPAAPAPLNIEVDKLRPGMNPEELERIRQEISRVARETMRGQQS